MSLRTLALIALCPLVMAAAAPHEATRFQGHGDIVWAVAFSPDGRRIVSAGGGDISGGGDGNFVAVGWLPGFDFDLRVWDVQTAKLLRRLEGNTTLLMAVAWSPDGRRIAAARDGQTLRIFEADTGKVARSIQGHAQVVTALAFSADSSRLLSGSRDATLRLWDVETGKEIRHYEGLTGRVWGAALSADGKYVAACGDDPVVRVWDAESGKLLHELAGHTEMAAKVAFSPDGRRLVSGGWDNTARLWDVETGKALRTFEGHSNRVEGVGFSPEGRRIATGSLDKTVRVWDVETGKELRRLEGATAPITAVVFSPDGRAIAAGSWDKVVRLWRVPLVDPVLACQVFPDAFTADGKLQEKVMGLVADLDEPLYEKRHKALAGLLSLGEEAAPVLLKLDRETLSAEQNIALDRVMSSFARLRENESKALRDDTAFLLDCLDSEHAPLRAAALRQLRAVTHATIEFDPDATPEARRNALAALRGKLSKTPGGSIPAPTNIPNQ